MRRSVHIKVVRSLVIFIVLGLMLVGVLTLLSKNHLSLAPDDIYSYQEPSRDGTGKIYMGREIAIPISGHGAIAWLERESRNIEERPDILIEAMNLKESDLVADIGAGSGYMSFRIAKNVPKGKVYAVEIDQSMITFMLNKIKRGNIANVRPILGTINDPQLPKNKIDVALMVDSYHEFSHPYEMMKAIKQALKSKGKVVLVEYKGEDDSVPIKPLHKMTVEQVKKEMQFIGLKHIATINTLPTQHIIIFQK